MKLLVLVVKGKWFDLIASGQKKIEYREIKPYWTKRLFGKNFDVIEFRRGYRKDCPKVTVEYRGLRDDEEFDGKKCYGLLLGKII